MVLTVLAGLVDHFLGEHRRIVVVFKEESVFACLGFGRVSEHTGTDKPIHSKYEFNWNYPFNCSQIQSATSVKKKRRYSPSH